MQLNEDIKALAKRAFELSQLPAKQRDAYRWEALAVNGVLVGAATPEGVAKGQAELEARFGPQIRAQGLAAILDPWWLLRRDDERPPVISVFVESALSNPNRPLASVLGSFAAVEPDKRAALTDQVRAFLGRAFAGALADARNRYVDLMRSRPEFKWPRDPWAAVLPYEKNPPPASILVDGQGEDHDGGIYDNPEDDTALEKIKFGWQDAVRTWDPWILKYNPPALFYQGVAGAASAGVDVAKDAAAALQKPIEGAVRFGKMLVTGVAVTSAAALLIYVYNRSRALVTGPSGDLQDAAAATASD